MDRRSFIGGLQLILLAIAGVSRADVISVDYQTAFLGTSEEEFAESRFGSPPHSSRDHQGPNRSPAGLEFSTKKDYDSSLPNQPPKQESQIAKRETASAEKKQTFVPLSASRNGIQEISVIAGELGFFPKTIFVTRDIPVKMFVTGVSKKPLCIMLDTFQVRKQLRAQKIEEIDFTPSSAGQFRFYCPVNGMEGTLFVKDSISTSEPMGERK